MKARAIKNLLVIFENFSYCTRLKVPVAAYLKASKKYSRMAFSFWHICFRSKDINGLFIMQIRKVMT